MDHTDHQEDHMEDHHRMVEVDLEFTLDSKKRIKYEKDIILL